MPRSMLTTFSSLDLRFMKRALMLAALGRGLTLPNPQVGAVLAQKGKIIGEGYHKKAGCPHAEVEAIGAAEKRKHQVEGATLYVTLEPCSTWGRTPPCTELIIRKKISRVVIAAIDPNPLHAGLGITILRHAGILVSSGLLAEEATEMNHDFNFWIAEKHPWVVAKIALSLDGRIIPPERGQRWLTSPEARLAAHELRRLSDAILIGAETARQDDPRLTVRLSGSKGKEQPWRIVMTRSGKLPKKLALFTDRFHERTLVFKKKSLKQVLKELGKKGISHVLIEGGGRMLAEAFRYGVVNEVAFFIAPLVVGTKTRALRLLLKKNIKLKSLSQRKVGRDLFFRALVK